MKQVLPFLALHLLAIGLLAICITGALMVDLEVYGFFAGVTLWPVIDTGWATLKEVRAVMHCEPAT
ncbi:MAG: hypothetical protein H5U32_03195 [Pseudomonas balearica]|uniref:hypothetical protein n=1 Tax=Stutzerimonas balearica TaxID=74829 RepID=UPI00199A7070|nr:hypothetical protein [Stutzerimonas balearica]MBC7198234.1 hypothetical protein [Stutzerimonas balearica]